MPMDHIPYSFDQKPLPDMRIPGYKLCMVKALMLFCVFMDRLNHGSARHGTRRS
jgi:hypothetical protein